MKISRTELQKYFAVPLPHNDILADAFTFHAFEIDGIENDIFDIKVLPNRTHDCNSAEGLSRMLSAILDKPLKNKIPFKESRTLAVSLIRINAILGTSFSTEEIVDVFRRLDIPSEVKGDILTLHISDSRPDLLLPEDVAEEVGCILGYDRVPATELPNIKTDLNQTHWHGIERIKDELTEQGFTEVSTQSFAKKGEVYLANPMDKTKPALRTTLETNVQEALTQAKRYAPLVLVPGEKPKLFEVGTVFPKDNEHVELRTTEKVTLWNGAQGSVDNLSVTEVDEYGKNYTPKLSNLNTFTPFSHYPFISRDIALWVPVDTAESTVEKIICENAGELCNRIDQFDHFEKEGRVSLAFRLVFQSMEKTLTDKEVNSIMEKISEALVSIGYEVR